MNGMEGLRGKRILVAEDEYFIADAVVEMLEEEGAVVVGPVATVDAASRLAAAQETGLDAALLDVNLNGRMIWPVLDLLAERGVPVVLATGYEAGAVPQAYSHLPRCEKPVMVRDLLRTLAKRISP